MDHRTMTVRDIDTGRVLGTEILLADTFWRRLVGLLPRRDLRPGEGLLLSPCHAVHTWFMGFAIDILFLDQDGRVLAAFPTVPPGRALAVRGAARVLELPAGTLDGIPVPAGARLEFLSRNI